MKFNLSVFDIYSKTMVVESAVVDFKGLVAILGHLGGIRDITITDDYSVLKSTHGVSITSRRTIGPSYRFDISLVKDEKVEEESKINWSDPAVYEEIRSYDSLFEGKGKDFTFGLSVIDDRTGTILCDRIVDGDVVIFALETFLGFDVNQIRAFMVDVWRKPHIGVGAHGAKGSPHFYTVTVLKRG